MLHQYVDIKCEQIKGILSNRLVIMNILIFLLEIPSFQPKTFLSNDLPRTIPHTKLDFDDVVPGILPKQNFTF